MGEPHPLAKAVELAEAFLATLDNSQSSCPCCGVTKYNNWTDHLRYEATAGAITRMRRTMGEAAD